jgi:hypothetical protein
MLEYCIQFTPTEPGGHPNPPINPLFVLSTRDRLFE